MQCNGVWRLAGCLSGLGWRGWDWDCGVAGGLGTSFACEWFWDCWSCSAFAGVMGGFFLPWWETVRCRLDGGLH